MRKGGQLHAPVHLLQSKHFLPPQAPRWPPCSSPQPPSRPCGLARPRPNGSLGRSPLDPNEAPNRPFKKEQGLKGLDNNGKNNNSYR